MPQEIYTAIELSAIGIVTVFIILYLITLSGRLLISFTNRFLYPRPDETKTDIAPPTISSSTVAAITATVEVITQGKGRIVSIEKLKES